MKILMLGWEFPPHLSGGLGTACHGLSHALARQGARILFVVPRASGARDGRRVSLLGADAVAFAPSEGGDVEILSFESALAPYGGAPAYERRLRDLGVGAREGGKGRARESPPSPYGPDLMAEVARYARAARAIARRERFDVVHAHDWMTYPAGIEAARASEKPLVVHVHATEHDRSPGSPDVRIEAIEQRGLDAADRVVCVSGYEAGVVARHYRVDSRKVRVVHNGVAPMGPRRRPPRRRRRAPVVLFLGRVTAQKGPGEFLEAAARVLEVERRATFVVAGSGDLLPSMVERAKRLGIARRVRFTGFLRGREVARAYAQADVYVMPSVSEPFGISPLEAMSMGVPTIVSSRSGVSEVVRHALVADPGDVEDLASKILAVLLRPRLARALSDAGRAEARRLAWDAPARKVLDVYREAAR